MTEGLWRPTSTPKEKAILALGTYMRYEYQFLVVMAFFGSLQEDQEEALKRGLSRNRPTSLTPKTKIAFVYRRRDSPLHI